MKIMKHIKTGVHPNNMRKDEVYEWKGRFYYKGFHVSKTKFKNQMSGSYRALKFNK